MKKNRVAFPVSVYPLTVNAFHLNLNCCNQQIHQRLTPISLETNSYVLSFVLI